MSSLKEIYFHVGTGKTGTTFLQYRVFPKFKGIHYIQRTRYKKAKKYIKASQSNKILLSREFDQQLEEEVKSFSTSFPETTPIIVFRRHDSYIASQYRRFVKNGFNGDFTHFFDLHQDTGYFKIRDLEYCKMIEILEQYFNQEPIVLIYEGLKKAPKAFIGQLAQQLDVSIDYEKVNLKKKHTSYSEKQLKAIRSLGRYINLRKRRVFKNSILHFLWKIYLGGIRYTTLYFALLIPDSFFSKEPLIGKLELEEVQRFFANDWEQCVKYAENQTKTIANKT